MKLSLDLLFYLVSILPLDKLFSAAKVEQLVNAVGLGGSITVIAWNLFAQYSTNTGGHCDEQCCYTGHS